MKKKTEAAAPEVDAAALPDATPADEQNAEATQDEITEDETAEDETAEDESDEDEFDEDWSDEDASDEDDEARANAEHPEAAVIRELLVRNGLKTAWILDSGICFDEQHARHMVGPEFDALPTISAE